MKRDLRVCDHAPLAEAVARARSTDGAMVIPLYVVEPDLLRQPDVDGRHYAFVRAALLGLRERLRGLGSELFVRVGRVTDVFESIVASVRSIDSRARLMGVLAHEETGNGWTFARDVEVGRWCRARGIAFDEWRQFGVVRRLGSRDGWARRWEQQMAQPIVPVPESGPMHRTLRRIETGEIPNLDTLGYTRTTASQEADRTARLAQETLESFLEIRALGYQRNISSPLTSERGSSRLSTHLAYGTLSMRQIVQATYRKIDEVKRIGPPGWGRSLASFQSRLHWHCHFIQKLESEPRIEFESFVPAFDRLRDPQPDQTRFDAWCNGRTGYPMVDACMRYLTSTGWLNFRMRSMLMSFAAYDLWLHWRSPAVFLARQFIDYEPGIHYCQCQMQSGTTGINTLRIYDPTKQGVEHDPQGEFIRKWVPELSRVPLGYVHEPWKMPMQVQREAGCRIGEDYPLRVVDHTEAVREAKAKFAEMRGRSEVRRASDGVQQRHGSRRSGLRQVHNRPGRSRASKPSKADAGPGLFDGM